MGSKLFFCLIAICFCCKSSTVPFDLDILKKRKQNKRLLKQTNSNSCCNKNVLIMSTNFPPMNEHHFPITDLKIQHKIHLFFFTVASYTFTTFYVVPFQIFFFFVYLFRIFSITIFFSFLSLTFCVFQEFFFSKRNQIVLNSILLFACR